MRSASRLLAILATLPSLAHPATPLTSPPAKPAPTAVQFTLPKGNWSFGFGWRQLFLREATFSTHTRLTPQTLPSFVGAASAFGQEVGPMDRVARRTYDDGYSAPDNSGSADGLTWNWGNDNASQIQGNRLQLHATLAHSEFTQTLLQQSNDDGSDRLNGGGPVLQAIWLTPINGQLALGTTFDLGYAGLSLDRAFDDFTMLQERRDYRDNVTDVFDLTGSGVTAAPHHGTFNGPGALVSNLPIERSNNRRLLLTERSIVTDRISQSLDLDRFSLSLGPTIAMHTRQADFRFGSGLALNLISWHAEQTEQIIVRAPHEAPVTALAWTDSASGLDLIPALYLQAGLAVTLSQQWFAELSARYEWSEDRHHRLGASEVTLPGTGASIQLILTRRF